MSLNIRSLEKEVYSFYNHSVNSIPTTIQEVCHEAHIVHPIGAADASDDLAG